MSETLPLHQEQQCLIEKIEQMIPGSQLELTDENGSTIAVVQRKDTRTNWPCEPGSAKKKGVVMWMSPDFNAPMDEYGNFEK